MMGRFRTKVLAILRSRTVTSTEPGPTSKVEPVRLTRALEGYEGRWVALKDGEVIAAQDTFDHLYQYLHANQIRGATIVRAGPAGKQSGDRACVEGDVQEPERPPRQPHVSRVRRGGRSGDRRRARPGD